MTSAGVCVMFTDETSDATVTNGRAETIALNSDVLCGNGGISNKTATSDVPVCDPEVCYMSAIVNLPGIIGLLIIGTHCSMRSTLHAFYVGQTDAIWEQTCVSPRNHVLHGSAVVAMPSVL